ncbi:MAG: 3-deoxy-D-manno-octulosonic acid transferase [Candidatus Omnitrophota bacterium]|nr:3-deoxy-D-manno-octulosonic acid transferase [Candidatus Omnitrophota bacterium]
MKIIYNVAFFIFSIFYLPYFVVTRRYRYGMKDRFGFLSEKIKSICSKNKIIWVHAVSVGEVKVAGILAPLLRQAFPSHKILFSTVTHTGNKVARTVSAEEEGVFYLPFDMSFIVDRVVRLVKPEIFICLETELWPNLICSLYKSGSRLILANGRISNRSYPRYKKSKCFVSSLLKKFSIILMQSGLDAERIIALGAPEENVFVTGNLKFDIPLADSGPKREELRKKINLSEKDILIVAGSTHRGEDGILISCFSRLKKDYPNLRLLIAPRHIERVQEIEKTLTKNGFETIKVSSLGLQPPASSLQPVFILDTMGELKSIYAAADIVFVGKSLVKKGGQNPIEPASLGKPVIFGRLMFNFQDAVKILLEYKAAVEVEGDEGLYSAIRFLLDNPEERKKLGINAREAIGKNSGSSQKTIELILK